MDHKGIPHSPAGPRPCACCGRIAARLHDVDPHGIQEGVTGGPAFILYPCRCGTTRALPWGQAPEELKEKAREADRARENRRWANDG